jgi:hypothetical protein
MLALLKVKTLIAMRNEEIPRKKKIWETQAK